MTKTTKQDIISDGKSAKRDIKLYKPHHARLKSAEGYQPTGWCCYGNKAGNGWVFAIVQ